MSRLIPMKGHNCISLFDGLLRKTERHVKKPFLLLLLFLVGCAAKSGVVPLGKDTYIVSRQAATGLPGLGNLKAESLREANKYCNDNNKVMQVINTFETSPPYVFGNYPRVEIQFMCLDSNDPELTRPKLKREADTVIKIEKE